MMTLDEMLALLPDNTTGAIDASDLRDIVTDLFTAANTYAQTFGYLWAVSGTSPSPGRATVQPTWGMASTTLHLNETTDDGQTLVFTLLDNTDARIILSGANGGHLRAIVTGPSIDNGSSRDIPIQVTSEDGIAPINGEKVSVTVLATIV